jgi:membrane protease YdiL (CAAX protease family)
MGGRARLALAMVPAAWFVESTRAAAVADAAEPSASPAVADPVTLSWWPVAWWTLGAIVAIVLARRIEWMRQMPREGPAWRVRPEASVFGFGAAFLATAIGAMVGAWWVGQPAGAVAGAAAGGLAGTAARSIGAHLGQLAVVIGTTFAPGARIPGGARAVGHGGIHAQPRGQLESLALALAFAIGLWAVVQSVGGWVQLVQQWWGGSTPAVGHRTLEAMASSGAGDPWWWATVLSAALLAPIAEEWTYRGLLQQGLKGVGLGRLGAVLVTSALFAIVHWSALADGARAVGVASLFTLSVGWGLLYERTGRMAAPVLAHALFNTANLVIATRG